MTSPDSSDASHIAARLQTEVLQGLRQSFVAKDEVVDLLGVCLAAGENLFILGPPGTAKSALVHALGQRLRGDTFSYLLTRFTEPNELFGPFDIRRLREGDLVTNTEGMLSEASLVFMDELLNANSAILNSLLTVLNERVLHRGRERLKVQALMFVGASNHLPEEDALRALFDRFLLRVRCDAAPEDRLMEVLDAGWRLESTPPEMSSLGPEHIRLIQQATSRVSLKPVLKDYVDLVHRIRHAGIAFSDRRAVKVQRLVAASALLCGRMEARHSDLWVLRYLWDRDEQMEVLRSLVQESTSRGEDTSDATDHPRASASGQPDAEALARSLTWLEGRLDPGAAASSQAYLRDRLAILEGSVQWVQRTDQREFLQSRIHQLWGALKTKEPEALAGV
ncbi:AAA family ATPase [Verrucomicrobium sp. BvORR034]|jgi:MoxR-like ATPase|uniref:AAA family ATPase n=1 Tax=Verrucomicrobium sp. BvORR034 TaxID=1396418 RepID=UPI000678E478|nr:AAA family ATPase [Verrucomicrobium sp. BvORR034]